MVRKRVNFTCSVQDCSQPARSKQLCTYHYGRFWRAGTTEPFIPKRTQPCTVRTCQQKQVARGYCPKHLARLYTHNDVSVSKCLLAQGSSPAERFWSRVDKHGPTMTHMRTKCWEWLGACVSGGYGSLWVEGRNWSAHRYAWFLAHGTDPATCVLHRCDNRKCVRPLHLFEGTHLDNVRDCISKGRNAVITERDDKGRVLRISGPKTDRHGRLIKT